MLINCLLSRMLPLQFSFLFYERGWQGRVFKVMKNDNFSMFLAVWVLSPRVLGRLRSAFTISWNDKNATCSCLPNCFSFVLWVRLAGRSVQSYEKWSFFSVFSRLGHFTQVFRQLKEWLILELHKTIRVSHAVACPIVLILFYDRDLQGGRSAQRYDKWSFFSIFSSLGHFPQVFGQVKEWLTLELQKVIVVSHVVACLIVFLYYQRGWPGRVFKII